ncbi:MAG TPA: prolyl oligopeptidase family serine peptidase [Opitutaceae bacterium]|nr:prolyl oligopeptidase family serine peptidase [Opitutaceae bacterium]
MFRRPSWFFLLLPLFARAAAPPPVDTGEIAGAKFAIARPVEWNHGLLLFLHDHRPEAAPLLADLDPGEPVSRGFIDHGWMVAKTSYRRNGAIIADAMADVDALRDYIAKTYGPPERVILEGESMGGTIAILLVERDDRYSGAVAIDPTFDVREFGQVRGLSLRPRVPLILLANQTELNGSRHYVSAKIRSPDDPVPVVFDVARDGHLNVNPRERLATLRTLLNWLDQGPSSLPKPAPHAEFFDATLAPVPPPSQVVFAPDQRGFNARVIAADPFTGNLLINAQPADLARLGLGWNSFFQLITHDRIYRVRYSHDFIVVKHGAWVGFPHADGFFLIGRNFANAADTAHLAVGDTVTIRRYDEAVTPAEGP